MSNLVSDRHPLVSLLLIVILVGTGFLLIGPGVGLAIASLFYDGNLVLEIFSNPDHTLFIPVMIMQGTGSFIGLILLPALYIRTVEHKPLSPFVTQVQPWVIIIPLLMVLGVVFQASITPVIEWNMNFQFPEFMSGFGTWAREREDALMGLTKLLTKFESENDFFFAFIVIALIPGIGEELVFRGLIQNELKRGTGNVHLAIWTAAFLFSAIHMQFFGFVPRMLLGALFGYLYHWSGNLIVPMFAHFFHNGFTLFMMYLYQIGSITVDLESTEALPWPWVITGIISTFALLYYFRNLYTTREQPYP